jgi:HTH-type transcriptional regulator, quorum sensing regulator NprR
MNSLGQKIKNLRKSKKITQQELCSGLVTPSMISQIESDRATPSNHLLEEIANRLGIPVSYFAEDVSVKTDLTQMYRKAKSLMDNERYEEALPMLQTVAYPLAPQFKAEAVYNDLANCYTKLGRLDEALNMYESVIQAAFEREDIPLAVHTYSNLGHIERKRNRMTVARMYWQRAAELLSRYPDISMPIALKIHSNLGKLYLSENRLDMALRSYKQASELAIQYEVLPDLAAIYHGMSYTCAKLHSLNQALHYNQLAIDAYQEMHNIYGINKCHINQAVILRDAGRYQEAIELLSSCIRSRNFHTDKNRTASAYAERAYTLLELGRLADVLEDAKQALELSGERSRLACEMRLLRAKAYMMNHYLNEGLEELQYCDESLILGEQVLHAEYNRIKRECLVGLGRDFDAFSASIAFAQKVLVS